MLIYFIMPSRLQVHTCIMHVGSSPTRGSSFFFGKVTALGVLCCFALLASFYLPSHLSLKHVYTMYVHVNVQCSTYLAWVCCV